MRVPVDDPPDDLADWQFELTFPWDTADHFAAWWAPDGSTTAWDSASHTIPAKPLTRIEALTVAADNLGLWAEGATATRQTRLTFARAVVLNAEYIYEASIRYGGVLDQVRSVFGDDPDSPRFMLAERLVAEGWPGDLTALGETVEASLQ